MDRRLLPRPIRRWLRRRFKEAGDRPMAEAASQSLGTSSGVSASAGAGGGSGFGRSARLVVPTPILLALVAIGAVMAGSMAYQAWLAAQGGRQIAVPGSIGGLHIVFLTTGQLFIGTLESVDRGTLVLHDVFYVQTAGNQTPVLPSAAQSAPPRGAQLVRRQDGDWHQPNRMAIPIERIMLLENVGRDSLVARLVGDARDRVGGGPGSAPGTGQTN